jgi:hypothetical protein
VICLPGRQLLSIKFSFPRINMTLSDLPDELLLKVVDYLKPFDTPRSVQRSPHALTLTHPQLWKIVDPQLYAHNVCHVRSSALLWGVKMGLAGTVQKSLQAKGDVETLDFGGQTPLWHAAARGDATLVRLLLEAGAKPEPRDEYGRTALAMAAKHGYRTIVELLISYGAECAAKDSYHHNPFLKAVQYGRTEAPGLPIVLGGGHPDYRDTDGYNMLGRAAEPGHLEMFSSQRGGSFRSSVLQERPVYY